jgi:hypothetical protein
MTLADGRSFLGHKRLGSKLYFRDCYPALQKEVEDLFAATDRKGNIKNTAVAFIGSPGEHREPFLLSASQK